MGFKTNSRVKILHMFNELEIQMTRDEATKQAEELTPTWLCPLLKDLCDLKCVCYRAPKVINYGLGISYDKANVANSILSITSQGRRDAYEDDWGIEGNDCANAMFFGGQK